MIEISKPAYNEEWRTLEFMRADGGGQLNGDETITSAEAIVTVRGQATAIADMISDCAPYGSPATSVRYKLAGGTRGLIYFAEFRINTSNGQRLADTLMIKVI